MSVGLVFFLIFLLFIKHIIVDFPVYSGYLCRKYPDTFNRLWVLHIILHGVGALIVFFLLGLPLLPSFMIALFDSCSHFIIDATTTYCNNRNKVDIDFYNRFYWVPELDQFLHCLTYVLMVLMMTFVIF